MSIIITVLERDTTLEVTLNGTLTTNIEIDYGELLPITAIYQDFESTFIENAEVQLLEGATILDNFTVHPLGDHYNLSLDSSMLNLGVHSLLIYAVKDTFSSASVSITITVTERDSTLEVTLNGTLTTYIEIDYGELLPITAVYQDLEGLFIENAEVQLLEGATILDNFTQHPLYDYYNLTINTNELDLGVNLLSIYAKKDTYSSVTVSIIITVLERDTTLEVTLNGTLTTNIEIAYGELLPITAVYQDFESTFIENAEVQLLEGATILENFTLHPLGDRYNLTINTNELDLGVNLLGIYAKKENYLAELVSITITVTTRDATLDVFLDGTDSDVYEIYDIPVNEVLNITAVYSDYVEFIEDANVKLIGEEFSLNFTEDLSYDRYNLTLNVEDYLGVGVHFLVISAEKVNYALKTKNIKINVKERSADLELFIDNIDKTDVRYVSSEIDKIINITVLFLDSSDKTHISGGNIRLTGALEKNLTELILYEHYNVSINTNDLSQGINFLTIFAQKEGYESQSIVFTVEVTEKDTYLQLFLNGEDKTLEKEIEVTIGDLVNISVLYRDYEGNFIQNATVQLVGEGLEDTNLTKHSKYNLYNLTLDSNDLSFGINFLTLYAQKTNYQPQTIIIKIVIINKESNLSIYLNGSPTNNVEVVYGEMMNITAVYEDLGGDLIENADLELRDGSTILYNFTKHSLYNQYNLTINSNVFDLGAHSLLIYANKENYFSASLSITVTVIERDTNLEVFLNGVNKTIEKSIEVPIGSSLDIAIQYFDIEDGSYIENATINLVGEGLDLLLNETVSLEQYSITIDTNEIDLGVRFLTIYAEKANYHSSTALLRIQVNRIRTNISTLTGETIFNREPGNDFTLKIELEDLDFNQTVKNATVSYTWAYGQGTLTDPDNDGIYEGTLTNLREGTFMITISVFASDDYDFERFQLTLSVVRPSEQILLFQVLTVVGIAAAIGIASYLVAYQRVLKYPKEVRKIRKFKKKMKKSQMGTIDTKSRDQLIEEQYLEEIKPIDKRVKAKITEKEVKTPNEGTLKSENGNIQTGENELNPNDTANQD
ncbi:MAG: hypothetical protein EU542_09050 [Promethearchaeota archaeon]|nr:MAG: hypothetical protein EU542_09050 [Candidatus Lokiarchaeota archaeon]